MAVVLVSMKKRGKNKWAVTGLAFLYGAADLGATHGLLIWKAKAHQRVCWGHMSTEGEVVLGRVTKRAKNSYWSTKIKTSCKKY